MNFPLSFGEWLKGRRKELDLTQGELAERASCTVFALRKIESGLRRPSKQLAGLLAKQLEISPEDQAAFIQAARGERSVELLRSLAPVHAADHPVDPIAPPSPADLPLQLTPLIGRETELAVLGKLLCEQHCRLLTLTGTGGIGKTRLAIELASIRQTFFPGGVYYVPLDSLNSPKFIVPAIAEAFKITLSGAGSLLEQLLNRLIARPGQPLLLVLDNLEHLLTDPSDLVGNDDIALLITNLLQRMPDLKILITSRERSNLREEWIFELHGLPVPTNDQINWLEDYSSVALFLQSARQIKMDFAVSPDERPSLVRICQLVEGTPLAIELAATWVGMLSIEEIDHEIASNLDFLTTTRRNIPERHRSLRAVFMHSWKLLSEEERGVLCRLAIFRGGFQRQAAEQVTGASLPVLASLLSKSLLVKRDNGRYDLHALIRQCGLEKLHDYGYFEETCQRHLAYFVSLAVEAHKGLRSAQLPEWLNRIEQEQNNIRAALEWAFMPEAPCERVEEGLCLITSINRYWVASEHILEGIHWVERGLQGCNRISLARAQALRIAAWLHNHGDERQIATAFLKESLAMARQLDDDTCQATALDTLGDVSSRFGDFENARVYYAESLELYRRKGDPQRVGLSLASAGRLHVDYGYFQEAETFLTEGLSLLERTSDLRGRAYCLNALGRLALRKGELKQAAKYFRQALRLNYELGYLLDISECLHELAVVEAIAGHESSATLLWAASTILQKRIGFTYPVDDPVYQHAPAGWLQDAPLSKEWTKGEKMSPDQAVAFALEGEME